MASHVAMHFHPLCLHAGFWPLKFALWIFLLGICFVMPNNTFAGYGQVARVLSGVWLIFQIIILLDFIYRINEWLLSKVCKSDWVRMLACMHVCVAHPPDSLVLITACVLLPAAPGWPACPLFC